MLFTFVSINPSIVINEMKNFNENIKEIYSTYTFQRNKELCSVNNYGICLLSTCSTSTNKHFFFSIFERNIIYKFEDGSETV